MGERIIRQERDILGQIKKTCKEVNSELLYDDLKDFILKHGVIIDDAKVETYSSLSES